MNSEFLSRHAGRLAAALAAAGAIAYVAFVFLPHHKALTALRTQVEEKQLAAIQDATVPQQIATATEDLLAASRFASAWQTDAPRRETLISLFRDINGLAQTAQATNLKLEPAPLESLAAIWRAPVELAVEGTWPQIFQFVRGLETLSPGIAITSIQISRATEDAPTLRMTATLTIIGPQPEFSDYATLAD